MPAVAKRRKAATLFFAAAVIVLCVGAVYVVPSAISKKNRNNNNNIGEDDHRSSLQTASHITQEGGINGGSISDKSAVVAEPAVPAPSMSSIYIPPTFAPTIAPNLGSDYPSIVPAKWGTVAPTAGWQQLVTDKGRHHAIKVKRQRHLRESYHEELKKRRTITATSENKSNNNKNQNKDNNNKNAWK